MMKRGRKSNRLTPGQPEFTAPAMSPHIFLFLFYNLLYLVPLLLAFVFGYEEGGVANVLDLRGIIVLKICGVYLAGVLAFLAGSAVLPFLKWSRLGRFPRPGRFRPLTIGTPEWIAIGVLSLVYLASKVALIPLGVYQSYAFDTGSMTGGVWSFSTFCSEAMILAAVVVLFSKTRHNVLAFLFISALTGINMLHGTRIFFISSVMGIVFYAYVRGKLTLKASLIYGPIAGAGMLGLTYAIFLSRSAVSTSGAFSAAKIVSPVVYESVFSQMSLIAVVRYHMIASGLSNAWWFLHDLLFFTLPRFIVPDKDSSLFIGKYDWVSPLGAFSGYSQGLLYFGLFFPAFYFFLGLLGSWLYRMAQLQSWWFILYVLFSEDFMLHLMRDGYIISLKMFINSIQLVLILIVWRYILQACPPGSGLQTSTAGSVTGVP
jgi:hypothetical protein